MNFDSFLDRPEVRPHREHFKQALARRCQPGRHGDLPGWLQTLNGLPKLLCDHRNYDNTIDIGNINTISKTHQQQLEQGLKALAPWRKGPYRIFDSIIDSEWRSDWKWQRLKPHINSLTGRRVLDVGCGNGYHGWRMLGAGASHVVGIDPSMRFLVQFLAVQKYAGDPRFDFLPIGIEHMPINWPVFDTVFSMGVLYHRRNPINHLKELAGLISPGGELVLETLIIDESEEGILRPSGRYAKMRNVWSIMTVEKILSLLREAGYKNPICVDQNVTSLAEQRRTDWMQFHSLAEFLDPADLNKTIEGYPAPKRGIFIAQLNP